jgi:hypothetical protein
VDRFMVSTSHANPIFTEEAAISIMTMDEAAGRDKMSD